MMTLNSAKNSAGAQAHRRLSLRLRERLRQWSPKNTVPRERGLAGQVALRNGPIRKRELETGERDRFESLTP